MAVLATFTRAQTRRLHGLADWLEEHGFAGLDDGVREFVADVQGGRDTGWRNVGEFMLALQQDVWDGYANVGDEDDLPIVEAAEERIVRVRQDLVRRRRRGNPACAKPKRLVVERQGTGIKGLEAIPPFDGPTDAATAAAKLIGRRAYEVFLVMYLNVKNCVIGYEEFTDGSPDSVTIMSSGLIRNALLSGARAIITVHQHPSGDPTPSSDDMRLWERILRQAELMEILVLDNLIVTNDRYYSEREGATREIPAR